MAIVGRSKLLDGLGHSAMAQRYGLNGLEEARAYLAEPLLRSRLEETIAVITDQLAQPGQTLVRLMGGQLDASKTISSLTLFAAAGLPEAQALLDQIGQSCEVTQSRVGMADGICVLIRTTRAEAQLRSRMVQVVVQIGPQAIPQVVISKATQPG